MGQNNFCFDPFFIFGLYLLSFCEMNTMKILYNVSLLTCLFLSVGCQPTSVVSTDSMQTGSQVPSVRLVTQVVEASCGECQFNMEGRGCDLAVRIDGKSYFVDGAKIDDHGDAHSPQGMCNCIRKANVTGEIKKGRFVASAFDLLPLNETDIEGKQPTDR